MDEKLEVSLPPHILAGRLLKLLEAMAWERGVGISFGIESALLVEDLLIRMSGPSDPASAALAMLEHAVREMREAQKGFFKSASGSPERTAFLVRSKRLEAHVDALLAGPSEQPVLFGQQDTPKELPEPRRIYRAPRR